MTANETTHAEPELSEHVVTTEPDDDPPQGNGLLLWLGDGMSATSLPCLPDDDRCRVAAR
jgi:hypothetical protein